MTLSLRLSKEEEMFIQKYARMHKLSVSDFIRQTVMERIEAECDRETFDRAMAEYRENPKTYSLDDVETDFR